MIWHANNYKTFKHKINTQIVSYMKHAWNNQNTSKAVNIIEFCIHPTCVQSFGIQIIAKHSSTESTIQIVSFI